MRVLHFAGSFPPTPGGTSQRVSGLTADPCNEHLIVVPQDESSSAYEQVDHRTIRRANYPPGMLSRLPIVRDQRLANALRDSAVEFLPDILHAHNPMACALASLDYKGAKKIGMVYEAHGIMFDLSYDQPVFGPIAPLNLLAKFLAKRMARIRERFVLAAADRIIAQTNAAANRIRHLYPVSKKPIDVIYNGVDAARFDPLHWMDSRQRIRNEMGWEASKVILYAGYMNDVNGVDFLLECIEQMAVERLPNIRFAILGRGPLEGLVKSAAAKHPELIDYPGSATPDEMPGYYAACDVFTIPRPAHMLGELFLPMKLLEAMAMGKTLIVSDVAAMTDVVTHERNGLVFRKDDHADFIRTIRRVIDDVHDADGSSPLHALGIQARSDVLDRFTWEHSRSQLQSVYEQLPKS